MTELSRAIKRRMNSVPSTIISHYPRRLAYTSSSNRSHSLDSSRHPLQPHPPKRIWFTSEYLTLSLMPTAAAPRPEVRAPYLSPDSSLDSLAASGGIVTLGRLSNPTRWSSQVVGIDGDRAMAKENPQSLQRILGWLVGPNHCRGKSCHSPGKKLDGEREREGGLR